MMSLLTNDSAMSALRVLAGTQRAVDETERQVSTGLKIADPSDGAAYWSIGVGMRSRAAQLGAVQDGLSLSEGILDVTKTGLDAILSSMTGIRDDVVRALQGGVDRSALQADIEAHQYAMVGAATAASFNGVNLLATSASYVETTAESRTVNGGAFVFEDGTDTYALSDSVGVTSTYQDRFTVDASGIRSYTSVADIPARPFSTLSLPASADDGAPGAIDVDLDALNMTQVYASTQDDGTHPGDAAVLITTDVATDPATVTTATDLQNYNQARSGAVASSVAGANVFNQYATLHAFSGTAESVGAGVAAPYATGLIASATPAVPRDGDVVTLTPTMSMLTLSVADHAIHAPDGTTTGTYSLSDDDLHAVAGLVQSDMAQVVKAQAMVGSYRNTISIQRDFNAALSAALTSGVGALVDADMGVVATRLQALQTRQRLGMQALSIANDNAGALLRLFG